jgi:hypothetical protein
MDDLGLLAKLLCSSPSVIELFSYMVVEEVMVIVVVSVLVVVEIVVKIR